MKSDRFRPRPESETYNSSLDIGLDYHNLPDPKKFRVIVGRLGTRERGLERKTKTTAIQPPVGSIEWNDLLIVRGIFESDYLKHNSPLDMSRKELINLIKDMRRHSINIVNYSGANVRDLRNYVYALRERAKYSEKL